jgi:hypothetical protein
VHLTQFIALLKICLVSRYSSPLSLVIGLGAFVLGALGRYRGEYIDAAVLLQALALLYVWWIYIFHSLPQLAGLRNNKNFQLIQMQKPATYWSAVAISALVASLTLLFLVPFKQPIVTNTLLIAIMTSMSLYGRKVSPAGELGLVCQPLFAVAMVINLLHWSLDIWPDHEAKILGAAAVIFVIYAWALIANYRNWVRRLGGCPSSEATNSADAPYPRHYNSQHKNARRNHE